LLLFAWGLFVDCAGHGVLLWYPGAVLLSRYDSIVSLVPLVAQGKVGDFSRFMDESALRGIGRAGRPRCRRSALGPTWGGQGMRSDARVVGSRLVAPRCGLGVAHCSHDALSRPGTTAWRWRG